MPAVALPLRAVERAGQLGGKAAALPVRVATGEGGGVLVAELLERLRRESRAAAGGAVEKDRPGVVGSRLLDARLEVAARDVDRAGNTTLRPLVELTDIDDEQPPVVREELTRLGDVDLVDLRLDLLQKFPIVRHRFRKDSDAPRGYARNRGDSGVFSFRWPEQALVARRSVDRHCGRRCA